jgi:hypothetical protein
MANETLIQEAVERFKQASEAYSQQRLDARADLEFVAGDQWAATPQVDELQMTVNLLGPFLRQITAEARSANPSIRVVPVGTDADEDLADIRGGLIRHIEQTSNSENVYQKALWYAAAAGEGYIFIDTEYCSEDSFDQDLVLKECNNPETVFLDPNHEAIDGSDAEWGFIIKNIPQDDYRRQFPSSKLAEDMGNASWKFDTLPNQWAQEDSIVVAKYWVKEYSTKTIYKVQDPITLDKTTTDMEPADDMILLNTRKVQICTVKGYLLNALEVLSETTWASKNLPIIKVSGENFYVGGQKTQYGAIRFAKDPQKQYNYFVSKQTEMIDLAPKSSFVGASGQFANNPEKWANANRTNYGFLDYTPVSLGQTPLPAPTRVQGLDMGSFQGVLQSRSQALEDMKLVFGLNDASLGAPGNETSGVAINARVEQSSRSTYHFFDNLMVSLKTIGRQLNELIPVYYDTERTVRIVKPSQEEMTVLLNSSSNNNRYDMSKGQYDIVITTGPAYASKRSEAYDALSGLMQILPQASQVIGDLVASQVDSPIAKIAAARLKATIPPNILAATGEDNKGDMAPKEQVAQLQQKLSQMTVQMQTLAEEHKVDKAHLEILKAETALELTKMDHQNELKGKELVLTSQTVEVEAHIKMEELRLQHRKLDLEEMKMKLQVEANAQELALNATKQMHEINETMHPDRRPVGEDIHLQHITGGDTEDISMQTGIAGGM